MILQLDIRLLMTGAEYETQNTNEEKERNDYKDYVTLMLKLIAQLDASRLE